MAEARAKAAATVLLSLALLAGACADAGDPTSTVPDPESPTAEASPRPTESTPPATEPTATTPGPEEPAPPATTDPAEAATTTEAAPPPPPTTADTNPTPPPDASTASEPTDEASTTTEAAPLPDPPPTGETAGPPAPTKAAPTAPPNPPPASQPPDESAAAGEADDAPAAEALPGEPYEWGPDEGTSLAVVGVPYEEVLALHDVPSGEIVATLDASNPYEGLVIVREAPSGEFLTSLHSWTGAVVSTGRTRRLPDAEWPDAVWNEVRVAGRTGWASAAHLAPIGLTDDRTAHLIDLLGARPEADTLIELALIIGEAVVSAEPPSRVVVVTRPIVFEALGEVTVDVLNLPDDSLLGYRLHVFATPAADDWMSENPGPFTLRTLERTILCQSHRGVTTDGLCG